MDTTHDSDHERPDEGAPTPGSRPIGFWLRAVDALISAEFAAVFQDEGISRREWMLLNALDGTVEVPWLDERLARGSKHLRHLADLGWVEQDDDGAWRLSAEGTAAKERLGTLVDGIREKVAESVSPEDFATTLASLEAIASTLGWDEDSRMPRRGGSGRGRFGPFGFGRGGFGRGGFGPFGFGPSGFEPFGSGPLGFGGFGGGFDGPHGHPHHHHADDETRHGGRGHRGHRGHHGHHGGGKGGRRAERAYERGFEAGFTRGRDAQSG